MWSKEDKQEGYRNIFAKGRDRTVLMLLKTIACCFIKHSKTEYELRTVDLVSSSFISTSAKFALAVSGVSLLAGAWGVRLDPISPLSSREANRASDCTIIDVRLKSVSQRMTWKTLMSEMKSETYIKENRQPKSILVVELVPWIGHEEEEKTDQKAAFGWGCHGDVGGGLVVIINKEGNGSDVRAKQEEIDVLLADVWKGAEEAAAESLLHFHKNIMRLWRDVWENLQWD